jgi:hypothetical protein
MIQYPPADAPDVARVSGSWFWASRAMMGHSRTRRIPSSGRFASFEINTRVICGKLFFPGSGCGRYLAFSLTDLFGGEMVL